MRGRKRKVYIISILRIILESVKCATGSSEMYSLQFKTSVLTVKFEL